MYIITIMVPWTYGEDLWNFLSVLASKKLTYWRKWIVNIYIFYENKVRPLCQEIWSDGCLNVLFCVVIFSLAWRGWCPSCFNSNQRLLRLHSLCPSMEAPITGSYWSKTSSTFKSHPLSRNAIFCQNNCSILALPGQLQYAIHILACHNDFYVCNLILETWILRSIISLNWFCLLFCNGVARNIILWYFQQSF